MKWSFKVGKIAGIGIYIHVTFLLLIGWVAMSHLVYGGSFPLAIISTLFMLALFACVLLHELGHALMAKRYGIRTQDITLLPIGGVARLERIPEKPKQELMVALAGPFVNILIAAILFGVLQIIGRFDVINSFIMIAGPFLARLLLVNLFLAGFNLLPAFPMDGGRVLRALLAIRFDYARATKIAGRLGQVMAVLLGVLGLLWNPFLVFIAIFVWMGASQEMHFAIVKSVLAGVPVRRAMLTNFRALSPMDTVGRAAELLITGSQHDFPVVENDRVLGIIAHQDLLNAVSKRSSTSLVSDLIERDVPTIDSSDTLEKAFLCIQKARGNTLPVTSEGRLVGILTMENLAEFVMLQSALEKQKKDVAREPEPVFGGLQSHP